MPVWCNLDAVEPPFAVLQCPQACSFLEVPYAKLPAKNSKYCQPPVRSHAYALCKTSGLSSNAHARGRFQIPDSHRTVVTCRNRSPGISCYEHAVDIELVT